MFGTKVDPSLVHGVVAPGFEEVEEEFRRNFSQRGELGAACAVYHRGEKVVDLWGGYRDLRSRAPWKEDTMVVVFSATKGMSCLAMALAHSRGLLDYDERVAAYWPEFAQAGKDRITVRQILSHQAGLCALDQRLGADELADLDRTDSILARQRPAWMPGEAQGYHAITLGWYAGAIIRRVDPAGRSMGRFLREEIAEPLGEEFYIGLPESVPSFRLAHIEAFRQIGMPFKPRQVPWGLVREAVKLRSLTARAFLCLKFLSPADFGSEPLNRVEIPAGNGIGTARAIARAYGAFATGGAELGLKAETLEELYKPAKPSLTGRFDRVLRVDTNFSLGYWKPFQGYSFGSSPRSFGMNGAGGSFGFADPDAQVGFAYVMNNMGIYLYDDPREKPLRDALYRCLDRMRAKEAI